MGAVIAFTLAAWMLFAASLGRHQRELFNAPVTPTRSQWMRAGGWAALGAGLACAIFARGGGQGPIFWGATLVLTALATGLLLTWSPRRAPVWSIAGICVAIVAGTW